MMHAIELQNITFSYDGKTDILHNLDFTVDFGEFAVLQGVSGTGKTTLLSVINGVIPGTVPGKLTGQIFLSGQDMTGEGIARRARFIGSVLQNADDQIVHDRVDDEVAFGCENIGMEPDEIEKHVQAALEQTHLKAEMHTRKLSGGQKQRLITASIFAMGQKTVILDEPLANLDRESAVMLLRTLKAMTEEGYAVLLVEHRLDLVLPFADVVHTLDQGKITSEKEPTRLGLKSGRTIPYDGQPLTGKEKLISVSEVYYAIHHIDVLRSVTMDIREGERTTLLGPNGCGKTTLLRLLARLIEPTAGGYTQHVIRSQRIHAMPEWFRKTGYVYQNPSYQLFMPTVYQEVARCAVSPERAKRMIEMFGLAGLEDRHPQSLSEGQKRRTDVACVCATDPKVLFLDEPTVGQDFEHLRMMLEGIRVLQKESGCALVTVTHDERCKDALSDRKLIMKQGRIIR